MLTILVIVLLIILLGGGGGYYAHGRYGGAGLGGVLGLVLVVLVVLWLVGVFSSAVGPATHLRPDAAGKRTNGVLFLGERRPRERSGRGWRLCGGKA